MKKICIAVFAGAVMAASLPAYAQDGKKEETPKAKTEQVEKKSGEEKSCCAEKAVEKEKTCCKEAAAETKSGGKKK